MSAPPVVHPDGPPRYEIRLHGRVDQRWAAWFDGLTLTATDDGTTVLRGPVVDQAALHGVLQRVRDLGLPLISLTRLDRHDRAPLGDASTTCPDPHVHTHLQELR